MSSNPDWKPIPGWPYEVDRNARIRNARTGHVISQHLDKQGYCRATLRNNGTRKTCRVHRLVLLAFAGAPERDDMECNHLDGDKQNNAPDNLEWATPAENREHAYEVGLLEPRAPEYTGQKISAMEAQEIREKYAAGGVTYTELGEEYGIHRTQVGKIVTGEQWKSAGGPITRVGKGNRVEASGES